MARFTRPALAAMVVVATAACGSTHGGTSPADTPPANTVPSAQALAKLAAPLAARLPHLPSDQPVRLVVTLVPGTATGPLRAHVEALGGRLLQRFTLIEGAVVTVPGRQVLALAQLAEIRGLELADSGTPPP